MADKIPEPFASLSWCQAIFNDPTFKILDVVGYRSEGYSPFWRELLSGGRGVRARLSLYRPSQIDTTNMESRELLDLGPALIGQQGICHGGFLATFMDESSGLLIRAYDLDGGVEPYTVTLNMTYKKPVVAPGVIMSTAKILRRDGRKLFLQSTIVDGNGDVCVVADSLFVKKREAL